MIDFRYHIVSIAAVFLALALGLVLGSTAGFRENAISDLDKRLSAERKAKQELRSDLLREQQLVRQGDQLLTLVTPELVEGSLEGERVALLSAPGAKGALRDDVTAAVVAAGGEVAVDLRLDDSVVDPASLGIVQGLVDRLAPETPSDGAVLDRAAAALAAAVLVEQRSRSGAALSSDGTALLAGFREAGLLSVEGDNPRRASLVIVVGADPSPEEAAAATAGLVSFATAFDRASEGAVVVEQRPAGDGESGLVSSLRRDQLAAASVSTVDDAGTAGGALRLVRALVAERRGLSGQYGTGGGAKALLATPSPAP